MRYPLTHGYPERLTPNYSERFTVSLEAETLSRPAVQGEWLEYYPTGRRCLTVEGEAPLVDRVYELAIEIIEELKTSGEWYEHKATGQ